MARTGPGGNESANKIEFFRRKADEARQAARSAATQEIRTTYLSIAETYDLLAAGAADLDRKRL
jgi:hypothetical protein